MKSATVVLAALAILAVGCGSEGGGTDKPDPPTMSPPNASGSCPGQMFVGIPVELNFRVTNPGKVAYPATYFAFLDGSGPLIRNFASSDGAPAIDRGFEQGGWEFRGILKPGESRRISMTLTPKDAGNFDSLDLGIWGAREDFDGMTPYGRVAAFSCSDVTINPGF